MDNDQYSAQLALLRDFGVPGDGPDADEVREGLARLLATKALSLVQIQISRDLAFMRGNTVPPAFHLLVAVLFLSRRAGNTFFHPEKAGGLLKDAVWQETSAPEENLRNASFLVDLWKKTAAGNLASLAGDPVLYSPDGFPGVLFFQRDYRALLAVNEAFSRLITSVDRSEPMSDYTIRTSLVFQGFSLEKDQEQAVRTALSRLFSVITGGPGTGKTTIVCSILRALLESGTVLARDIALCAPTGRAAQRLGEAIADQAATAEKISPEALAGLRSLRGMTIHSLLGGGYDAEFKYHADVPLPQKVVVVDEVSMVDLGLMRALLDAIPTGTRLILLGDPDQLPPVNAGAVLGDLVGDLTSPFIARLTKARRYDERLGAYARAINEGDVRQVLDEDSLRPYLSAETGFFRLPETDPAEALEAWVENAGLFDPRKGLKALAQKACATDEGADALLAGRMTKEADELFQFLNRTRILAVLRLGPLGVNRINKILLARQSRRASPEDAHRHPGVPILITSNAKDRGLFNGDVGVAVTLKGASYVLFPKGKEGVFACPVALLPEHDLAYATTVHKSQGSQYDDVLVILPDDASCSLLSRQILYTGVTRARRRAVVLGRDDILRTALERNITRDTGVRITNR